MSKNFLFAKLFSLNIVAHLFIIQIITLSVFYLPTLLLTYLQRSINIYNYSLTITDSHSSTCTLVMLILFGLVLLKFMHKPKYEINPRVFIPNFCEVGHQHPTRFSRNNFDYIRSACKITSFPITFRCPTILNIFLSQHKKSDPHLLSSFKNIKSKLLHSDKET